MKSQKIVTQFKKSTASQGDEQDCVEVARTADGGRAVRDTKSRGRATQFYAPAEWAAFVAGVKAGSFGG